MTIYAALIAKFKREIDCETKDLSKVGLKHGNRFYSG